MSLILGPGEWNEWFTKWGAMVPDQFTKAFHCLMHRDDVTERARGVDEPQREQTQEARRLHGGRIHEELEGGRGSMFCRTKGPTHEYKLAGISHTETGHELEGILFNRRCRFHS